MGFRVGQTLEEQREGIHGRRVRLQKKKPQKTQKGKKKVTQSVTKVLWRKKMKRRYSTSVQEKMLMGEFKGILFNKKSIFIGRPLMYGDCRARYNTGKYVTNPD